jgi:hypothetical protein
VSSQLVNQHSDRTRISSAAAAAADAETGMNNVLSSTVTSSLPSICLGKCAAYIIQFVKISNSRFSSSLFFRPTAKTQTVL